LLLAFNNTVALCIHTVIAIAVFNLHIHGIINVDDNDLMLIIVVSVLYIICGLIFLRTVHRRACLSVSSVFIALFLLCFFCVISGVVEAGLAYLFSNMIYADWLFKRLGYSDVGSFVSTIIPSLLMYIGLLLKMWCVKMVHKNY